MPQRTGRVTVKLDGVALRSKPGASMQIGGFQRDWDMTDQGEPTFAEKKVNGMMKCTMPHLSDTDLERLRAFKNGTVQFVTDTGQTWTMAKAGFTSAGDLSNGEVEVTFNGAECRQSK